jgi:hypothetical protein
VRIPLQNLHAFVYQVGLKQIVVSGPSEIFALRMLESQIEIVRPADVRLVAKVSDARIGSSVFEAYLLG